MIDVHPQLGHNEPLAVFIYHRSYLIEPYKNVNHVDFEITTKDIIRFIPILLFHNAIYLLVFYCASIFQIEGLATSHFIAKFTVNNNRYISCREQNS
jgi:hypothetical protein